MLTRAQGAESPLVRDLVSRLTAILARADSSLNMQDLAWATWGACAAAEQGLTDGERAARSAFALIRGPYIDPRSGLPRHSTRHYRRDIISFGSLTYFLRATFEYGSTFDDPDATAIFRKGVGHAIGLQGPLGEWPWIIGVRTGSPVDVYPVFSVHQDSMAMLFLLPARDATDLPTASAIEQSLAWGYGNNELGAQFYLWSPFRAYRAIERAEGFGRARRYSRSLVHRVTGHTGTFGGASVRINSECRSYHLGWILFAWAGRPEVSTGGSADASARAGAGSETRR